MYIYIIFTIYLFFSELCHFVRVLLTGKNIGSSRSICSDDDI